MYACVSVCLKGKGIYVVLETAAHYILAVRHCVVSATFEDGCKGPFTLQARADTCTQCERPQIRCPKFCIKVHNLCPLFMHKTAIVWSLLYIYSRHFIKLFQNSPRAPIF